jgi:hypothetical protein
MKKTLLFISTLFCFTNIFSQCPDPSPVTASPAVICQGDTTALNATSAGNSILWYTVPAGGTPIGTSLSGNDFSVSPIVTTTYYAEAIAGAVVVTNTFNFTNTSQNYTVPAGVTTLTVDVRGAKGGMGYQAYSQGGNGGRVTGTIAVTSGQVLRIYVGGMGGNGSTSSGGAPGYNGGGLGSLYSGAYAGGGGGGASDIRIPPYALADRIAVGGGGGGAGFNYSITDYERGGYGGGLIGEGGYAAGILMQSGYPGAGGTQTAGGVGGYYSGYCGASNGSLGIGGNGGVCTNAGGAGGGGYYGGGAGVWAGGGGGSSFLANGTHTQGFQSGNGQVIISASTFTCFSNRIPVTVTVNPSPSIIVSNGTVCVNNSYTINPSGASSYTYSSGGPVVTPTVNSSYTIVGTSSLGCISLTPAVMNVSIVPLPVLGITGQSVICTGGTVNLTANGAVTYSWSTGSNAATIAVTPTTNTVYVVTGTGSNNCIGSYQRSVTVNPLPQMSTTGTGIVCSGQSTTLTACCADGYFWSSGATSSMAVVAPTVNTTYTVNGVTAAGCTKSVTATVFVTFCTGINGHISSAEMFNVYPNPNFGELIAEVGSDTRMTVNNVLGKTVLSTDLKEGRNQLDIKELPNGVYFLHFKQNGQVKTIRIIKE